MKSAVVLSILMWQQAPPIVLALPAPPDPPEEVARTEVITGARSPIDNQPMTATQYAELQAEINRLNETPPQVSQKVRNTIALLKLRKFLKTVLPFIPIK
jgi:hypothetical protein